MRPLPVRDPGSLGLLADGSWSYPLWEEIKARETELFDGAFAWSGQSFNLSQGGQIASVDGAYVTGRFFHVPGVPAYTSESRVLAGVGCGSEPRPPVALEGAVLTADHEGLYVWSKYMVSRHSDDNTLKKGTAELLVLAQLESRPRHGYEIARQIDARTQGTVSFQAASLYPILYRLERRGLIAGRWVEKAGQRRRRYYTLTAAGRKVLAERRRSWSAFMRAVQAAAGPGYA